MKRNDHNKSVGSVIERSDDRINATSEVFTPMDVCVRMIDEIPDDIKKNPNSTFLDNSAGSGNFLVTLKNTLLQYHDEEHILNNMLYAVELMEDNHLELCKRLGVESDHPHYVCNDALTYDYSFGKPVGLEAFYECKEKLKTEHRQLFPPSIVIKSHIDIPDGWVDKVEEWCLKYGQYVNHGRLTTTYGTANMPHSVPWIKEILDVIAPEEAFDNSWVQVKSIRTIPDIL